MANRDGAHRSPRAKRSALSLRSWKRSKHRRVNDREHILQHIPWSLFNELHAARSKISRLHLLAHHKTCQRCAACDGNMKWHFPVRIGDRAADRCPCAFVESLLAHHQRGSAFFLFVASLRIEIQHHQISLLRNPSSHYQTSRPLVPQSNPAVL